jgi:ribosomal protein S28E/S33
MSESKNAEMFHYQRLLGVTEDGLQMKVTIITTSAGRVRSASIQMRAVEGPVSVHDHPASWSKAFPLKLNVIGQPFDDFDDSTDTGGAA